MTDILSKLSALTGALLLSACQQPSEAQYDADWDHPRDAEVEVQAMERCLSAAQGPRSTQYNDWDEAIGVCTSFASEAARYCPKADMAKCMPQYRRSRSDVRSALKARNLP